MKENFTASISKLHATKIEIGSGQSVGHFLIYLLLYLCGMEIRSTYKRQLWCLTCIEMGVKIL